MSWFQLGPEQVLRRIEADGSAPVVPTLMSSVLRGVLGFTAVSLLGFAPWVIFGSYIHQHLGEAGLYAVCALVFIASAGPLLHRLIIGPGTLLRFAKLFALSFAAYSVAWTVGWMLWKGHPGSVAGLLVGTAVMGWMMVCAFDARSKTISVILALFLLNAAGYFAGGMVDAWGADLEGIPISGSTQRAVARFGWALSYGIGFGAGLGVAFYQCQAGIREALARGNWDDVSNAGLSPSND